MLLPYHHNFHSHYRCDTSAFFSSLFSQLLLLLLCAIFTNIIKKMIYVVYPDNTGDTQCLVCPDGVSCGLPCPHATISQNRAHRNPTMAASGFLKSSGLHVSKIIYLPDVMKWTFSNTENIKFRIKFVKIHSLADWILLAWGCQAMAYVKPCNFGTSWHVYRDVAITHH